MPHDFHEDGLGLHFIYNGQYYLDEQVCRYV